MAWRLPAEWEPQESVWLVWPRDPLTWPGRVDKARAAFVATMQAIAPQRVDLVVHPELAPDARATVAAGLSNVHLHAVEHQDSWIRDYGPLTLVSGRGGRQGLKFRFDAWGGKYESLLPDDEVPRRLADAWPTPFDEVDFVLEGGAVETDGKGTFLATESVCEGRGQEPDEFEDMLRRHLHAKHVVWLGEGIEGDDTDGHIDTIARFTAPGHVLAVDAPRDHPDHDALADNLRRLKEAQDARGKRLRVNTVPAAPAQATDDGMPLPAGYANFLITNEAVILPSYGGPEDAQARAVVAEAFPGRRIEPVDHRDLIWGMGGIHCLSMQVPRP